MAQPRETAGGPRELPAHDVRQRLLPLARMTALTGDVTVIVDGGRPLAALVPVDTACSRVAARERRTREQAARLGWQQRIERLREHLRAQHRSETAELRTALGQAWEAIDRLAPPGRDADIDRLRAVTRDVVSRLRS